MAESEDRIALIEEAERRGMLSGDDLTLLREMRNRGVIKSSRDKEELFYEQQLLEADADSMSDGQARGLASAYVRLRYGDRDDFDGRRRYEKRLDGRAYLKELQAELDPKNYESKLPNKYNEWKKMDREQRIRWADENVKSVNKESLAVENVGGVPDDEAMQRMRRTGQQEGLSIMSQSAIRSVTEGIATGSQPYDMFPPFKKLEEMTESEKDELIRLGEQEAWNQSYVPVRQFLEQRIERNRFLERVAREGASTGKIPSTLFFGESSMDVMTPEEQAIVSSYIKHTRPFDAEEGVLGTLNEAGRKTLNAAWWLVEGSAGFLANVGTAASTSVWMTVDPVNALDFEEALQRERNTEDMKDFTFEFKAPERSRLGNAVIGLGETAPFMFALAYGGGVGAFTAAASTGKSFHDEMLKKGATEEEALFAGALAGALSICVERLGGLAGRTKLGTALSKPIIAKAATDSLMKAILSPRNIARFTEAWTRGFLAEWGEEWIEGFGNSLIEDVVVDKDPDVIQAINDATRDAVESRDVVALMTFFGGAKTAMSSVSENAGDMTRNHKTLEHVTKELLNNVNNDREGFIDGAENVNQAIIDTWVNNSKSEARRLLGEMGISKDSLKAIEPELNRLAEIEVASKKTASERAKSLKSIEQRYEELRTVMQKVGVEEKIVQELTDNLDPQNVGQLIDNFIEVVDNAADPERIFNHEVFEWLDREGLIEEGDWAVFTKALDKAEYANLKLRYADVQGMEQVKEVMADAWAQWSPEERTVVQRVFDYIRKMLGIVTEKDVFRKLDTYLKEARNQYARENAQGVADAGTQEGIDGRTEGGLRLRDDAQTEKEIDVQQFVQDIVDAANTDLQTARDIIEKENELERVARENVDAQIDTRKARRVDNEQRMSEARKREQELEEKASELERLEREERAVIEGSELSVAEARDANKRAKDIEKQNKRNQYEIQQLKKEIAQIAEEEKANEVEAKKANEIDTIMNAFDRVAKHGDAMKSRVFKRMNKNVIESMFKGIGDNNPKAVREATNKLKKSIKDWNKLSVDQKKAAGQRLKAQGVRFARGQRLSQLDPTQALQIAAERYALAKVEGRDTAKIADRLGEELGRPAQEIAEGGEKLYKESQGRLEAGADRLAQRLGVRTVAAEKARLAELRKARKEGVAVAKTAQKAKETAEKSEAKEKARQKRESNGISANKLKLNNGIDVVRSVRDGGDIVGDIARVVEENSKGLADQYKARALANTLIKSLKLATRRLVSNRTAKSNVKASITDSINNLSNKKSMESVIDEANKIVDSIRKNVIEQTEDTLSAEITSLLNKHGKKPAIGKREKRGSSRVQNVMYQAKRYWKLSNRKADAKPVEMFDKDGNKIAVEDATLTPYEQAKLELNTLMNGINIETSSQEFESIKAEVMDKLIAIRLIDNAKRLGTVDSLDAAVVAIEAFVLEGEARWRKARQQKLDNFSKAADDMIADLENREAVRKPADPDKNMFGVKLMTPLDALEFTFGIGSKYFKRISDAINEKINLHKRESLAIERELNKIAEELGLGTLEDIHKRWSKRDAKLSKFSLDGRTMLSKNDLMTIIKRLERSDVIENHLRGLSVAEAVEAVANDDTDGINLKLLERYKMLPQMKEQFTAEELVFADALQGELETVFESLYDKIVEDTGLPPQRVDGYIKLAWDRGMSGPDAIVRTVADMPAWLLPTTKHSYDMVENEPFIMGMLSHLEEMLAYKHMDGIKEEVFNTLLNRKVSSQITKTFGEKYTKLLRTKMTEALINKPLYKIGKEKMDIDDRAYNALRTATATTSLFARIPSMFRQAGDFFAPLLKLDFSVAKEAMSMMLTPDGLSRAKRFALDPLVVDRLLRGYDMASSNLLEKAMMAPIKIAKTVLRGGAMVPGLGDISVMSLWGGQLTHIEILSDPNLSMMKYNDAWEIASARIVGRLEGIMQSQHEKDLSDSFRGANEMKKNYLQFLSADMPKLSKELVDTMRFLENAKDPAARKKFFKMLLVNHVLLPAPQILISMLTQWFAGDEMDDDEAWEAVITMLAGPYRAIALIGTMLFAVEGMLEGRRPNASTPAQRTLNSLLGLIKTLTDGDTWEDGEVEEVMDKFLKMIGSYRDIKDWSEFIDNL